ncbi:MAG: hypothetical protein IJS68_01380 [Clostridia bacterium]|nr:hypothetical protein [Clostridia bacterium]
MKNLLKTFAIMLCVTMVASVLVACGEAKLTAADVVGEYYTEKVVYTEGENPAQTYTFTQFAALHEDHSDPADAALYEKLEDYFLKIKVQEDGNVTAKPYYVEMAYADFGTWAIENNKLVVTSDMPEGETTTTQYDNGKIIVTVTDTVHHWSAVMTYAKVAA